MLWLAQVEGDKGEKHIGGNGALLGRRDPPQPPPPPLAPLSSGSSRAPDAVAGAGADTSVIKGPVVAEGESGSGLVNGIPHPEGTGAEAEDTAKRRSSLMLEDLLEKSVDVKEPPVLNGGVPTKDLRIGDHGLELVARPPKAEVGKQIRITERGGLEVVESGVRTGECELRLTEHGLELVDKSEADKKDTAVPIVDQQDMVLRKELNLGEKLLQFLEKQSEEGNLKGAPEEGGSAKRGAALALDEDAGPEAKRPKLEVNGNGVGSREESPDPDGEKVKASSSAANLYAALAASALEDEDEILLAPTEQAPPEVPATTVPVAIAPPLQATQLADGTVSLFISTFSSQPFRNAARFLRNM